MNTMMNILKGGGGGDVGGGGGRVSMRLGTGKVPYESVRSSIVCGCLCVCGCGCECFCVCVCVRY